LNLADIERGLRVLKSDIDIGAAYHSLPKRIRLLEQLSRIHQQTVETADGRKLRGLTEITSAQRSLFAALGVSTPAPQDLASAESSLRLKTYSKKISHLRSESVKLGLHGLTKKASRKD